MAIKSLKVDTLPKRVALLVAATVCAFAAWNAARWGMANSAAGRADSPEVAEYLTQLAPSDPQTHFATAVLLERSFDEADIQKALREFELAAAAAPDNYLYWFELGRARERAGDAQGAESALRRAIELAPNYARMRWGLGNALLRQGRTDEAFVEIRAAVAGDPALAAPAVVSAWQFYDGDLASIRNALGTTARVDAALATLLAREKRLDDAMAVWSNIPAEEKRSGSKEVGTALLAQMIEAKSYRHAAQISTDLGLVEGASVGQIVNGGFESAVKTDGAGAFEWRLSAGLEPQIVLTAGQKHGGNQSLAMVLNSATGQELRTISQIVAVEPGATYELKVFFKSDLRARATFKWDVTDADGKPITSTDAIPVHADWTPLAVRFAVPASTDGIVIRLSRESCGQVCPVAGNLWLDDITLTRLK